MPTQRFTWFLFIVSLATIGIVSRLIEHTPNFAPITALALTSGYYLRGRWSWLVPLMAMLVSDAFIGFYTVPVMAAVYGCYLVAWLLGRRSQKLDTLALSTLGSSVLFFLVTNAAVWAFTAMYAKTIVGLGQSYLMALPFFRASFTSDIIYTVGFVLIAELALAWQARRQNSLAKSLA